MKKLRTIIIKYLFQQPTLFSWLIFFGIVACFIYLVIGIIAIFQAPEGIMVFLILFYFIQLIGLVLLLDFAFRKLLKERRALIWILQSALFIVVSGTYYYKKLYKMEFIVNHDTAMIVLVQTPGKGVVFKHGPLHFKTRIVVPADNFVPVQSSFDDIYWYNWKFRSETGVPYAQFYPMQYGEHTGIRCGNKNYPIEIILLEQKGKKKMIFGDAQFDSLQKALCNRFGN